MSEKAAGIEGYLAGLPDDARATLAKVRGVIKAAAPGSTEVLAYGLAGFKYQGRPLVYYGAAKKHCALYGPAVAANQDDLKGYDTSRGTVRFPKDKPLPAALVRKLVKSRIADIEAAAMRKRKR